MRQGQKMVGDLLLHIIVGDLRLMSLLASLLTP